MSATMTQTPARHFKIDTLVILASEEIHVEGAIAHFGRSSRLGPGYVRDKLDGGKIHVHWIESDFDAWMNPSDLQEIDAHTRLISCYRCDSNGARHFVHHKFVTGKGLEHNWEVELRPEHLLRVVRSDGAAWTFDWRPELNRVDRHGTIGLAPAEDEDAEAFTVAELALGLPGWDPVYGTRLE